MGHFSSMKPSQRLAHRDKGILERKFVRQVLAEEGANLVQAHRKAIQSNLERHTGDTFSAVRHRVEHTGTAQGVLTVKHLKRQRFLDMKSLSRDGKPIKTRSYKVHNSIIFGHLNNVIRQLSFGFTEAVREKLKHDQTIELGG